MVIWWSHFTGNLWVGFLGTILGKQVKPCRLTGTSRRAGLAHVFVAGVVQRSLRGAGLHVERSGRLVAFVGCMVLGVVALVLVYALGYAVRSGWVVAGSRWAAGAWRGVWKGGRGFQ